MRRLFIQFGVTATMLVASCHAVIAAGSGMPWEAPLQRILESIEGPVAEVIAVVTIILTGLSPLVRRHGRCLPAHGAGGVRALHRLRSHVVLPVVLLLRRRRPHRLTHGV